MRASRTKKRRREGKRHERDQVVGSSDVAPSTWEQGQWGRGIGTMGVELTKGDLVWRRWDGEEMQRCREDKKQLSGAWWR